MLVSNWKELWKAWSMWFAAIGLTLPVILQAIADNSDSLPWFDDGWKSIIRSVCLAGVFLARPIKQESLTPNQPKELL